MSSACSYKICPSRDARRFALCRGFVFIEALFGTELLSPKTVADKTERAVTGVTAGFACVRWSAGNAASHGVCLFDRRVKLYSKPLNKQLPSHRDQRDFRFQPYGLWLRRTGHAQTAICRRRKLRALDHGGAVRRQTRYPLVRRRLRKRRSSVSFVFESEDLSVAPLERAAGYVKRAWARS